jgi:uncharacterized protein YukE
MFDWLFSLLGGGDIDGGDIEGGAPQLSLARYPHLQHYITRTIRKETFVKDNKIIPGETIGNWLIATLDIDDLKNLNKCVTDSSIDLKKFIDNAVGLYVNRALPGYNYKEELKLLVATQVAPVRDKFEAKSGLPAWELRQVPVGKTGQLNYPLGWKAEPTIKNRQPSKVPKPDKQPNILSKITEKKPTRRQICIDDVNELYNDTTNTYNNSLKKLNDYINDPRNKHNTEQLNGYNSDRDVLRDGMETLTAKYDEVSKKLQNDRISDKDADKLSDEFISFTGDLIDIQTKFLERTRSKQTNIVRPVRQLYEPELSAVYEDDHENDNDDNDVNEFSDIPTRSYKLSIFRPVNSIAELKKLLDEIDLTEFGAGKLRKFKDKYLRDDKYDLGWTIIDDIILLKITDSACVHTLQLFGEVDPVLVEETSKTFDKSSNDPNIRDMLYDLTDNVVGSTDNIPDAEIVKVIADAFNEINGHNSYQYGTERHAESISIKTRDPRAITSPSVNDRSSYNISSTPYTQNVDSSSSDSGYSYVKNAKELNEFITVLSRKYPDRANELEEFRKKFAREDDTSYMGEYIANWCISRWREKYVDVFVRFSKLKETDNSEDTLEELFRRTKNYKQFKNEDHTEFATGWFNLNVSNYVGSIFWGHKDVNNSIHEIWYRGAIWDKYTPLPSRSPPDFNPLPTEVQDGQRNNDSKQSPHTHIQDNGPPKLNNDSLPAELPINEHFHNTPQKRHIIDDHDPKLKNTSQDNWPKENPPVVPQFIAPSGEIVLESKKKKQLTAVTPSAVPNFDQSLGFANNRGRIFRHVNTVGEAREVLREAREYIQSSENVTGRDDLSQFERRYVEQPSAMAIYLINKLATTDTDDEIIEILKIFGNVEHNVIYAANQAAGGNIDAETAEYLDIAINKARDGEHPEKIGQIFRTYCKKRGQPIQSDHKSSTSPEYNNPTDESSTQRSFEQLYKLFEPENGPDNHSTQQPTQLSPSHSSDRLTKTDFVLPGAPKRSVVNQSTETNNTVPIDIKSLVTSRSKSEPVVRRSRISPREELIQRQYTAHKDKSPRDLLTETTKLSSVKVSPRGPLIETTTSSSAEVSPQSLQETNYESYASENIIDMAQRRQPWPAMGREEPIYNLIKSPEPKDLAVNDTRSPRALRPDPNSLPLQAHIDPSFGRPGGSTAVNVTQSDLEQRLTKIDTMFREITNLLNERPNRESHDLLHRLQRDVDNLRGIMHDMRGAMDNNRGQTINREDIRQFTDGFRSINGIADALAEIKRILEETRELSRANNITQLNAQKKNTDRIEKGLNTISRNAKTSLDGINDQLRDIKQTVDTGVADINGRLDTSNKNTKDIKSRLKSIKTAIDESIDNTTDQLRKLNQTTKNCTKKINDRLNTIDGSIDDMSRKLQANITAEFATCSGLIRELIKEVKQGFDDTDVMIAEVIKVSIVNTQSIINKLEKLRQTVINSLTDVNTRLTGLEKVTRDGFKAVTDQLNDLNRTALRTEAQLDTLNTTTDANAERLERLDRSILDTNTQLGTVNTGVAGINARMDTLNTNITANNQLQTALRDTTQSDALRRAVEAVGERVNVLGNTIGPAIDRVTAANNITNGELIDVLRGLTDALTGVVNNGRPAYGSRMDRSMPLNTDLGVRGSYR